MLGFTNQADQFTALTTTTNIDTFGTPEVTAAGTSAWGGGQNAWGGGKSAWGGGWNAWGGGWNAWIGTPKISMYRIVADGKAKPRDGPTWPAPWRGDYFLTR